MDLWAWVTDRIEALEGSGERRLAELMEALPDAVVNQRHEAVEAMVPEALALARARKDAWVELFVRHWLLQSRILHRHDVSHGLEEAVQTLDFAHRPETAGCPQASCVVQDVCSAWGVLDGPGYVDERLAVSEEGLAKIDPSWSCFGCITAEKASALEDGGRYDECVAFCRTEIARAEDRSDVVGLHHALARSLVQIGRVDEAVAVVDDVRVFARSKSQKHDAAIIDAYVRAAAGDVAAAAARLIPVDDLDAGDVANWVTAALAIARKGGDINNTAALGRLLRLRACELEERDARYESAFVFYACAELAERRGQPAIARLCLEDIARVRPRLRKPAGIDALAAAVAARLADLPDPPPLNVDVDPLDGDWRDALPDDPEAGLVVLRATRAVHPDRVDVALTLAAALGAAGFEDAATRELLALRAAHPDDRAVLSRLVTSYARQQKRDALAALCESPASDGGLARRLASLALADLDVDAGRAAAAADRLKGLVALDAVARDDSTVAARRAAALRATGDFQAAFDVAFRFASAEDVDRGVFWELCLAATVLGRHVDARGAAARLGFTFDGDGPIDEPFAYCKVRFVDAFGESEDWWALRISPVTARVTQRREPGKACVYGDVVAFVPTPVAEGAGPKGQDGKPTTLYTYPFVQTLRPGHARAFYVEGFVVDDAAIDALGDAVVDAGGVFTVHSGSGYRLRVTDELVPHESDHDGFGRAIVMSVVVPAGVDAVALARVVDDHARRWPRPLAYRPLLRLLDGNDARLAEQDVWADRWGFEDDDG